MRRTWILLAVTAACAVVVDGSTARPTPPPAAVVAGSPFTAVPTGGVTVGHSSKNDTSAKLRDIKPIPVEPQLAHQAVPALPIVHRHTNRPLTNAHTQTELAAPHMPGTTLNFEGIDYPGFNCFCAPPDTNGEVGATQYVQIVNTALQVFNKSTGASELGPEDIATLWSGFGGPCETSEEGDPVVLYDQLANRWVVSQFAGTTFNPTHECVAVSTSSGATGLWNRYDFNLGNLFGNNFYDYPKLSVWPDAYYMSMNVFNASGTAFLGPQPFALDRSAMLAGNPATIISTGMLTSNDDQLMPADLDGSIQPPAGAPNPFTEIGTNPTWKLWRFHVDFATPSNSTFTQAGTLTPNAFNVICGGGACVPQAGVPDVLDTLGDRSMFRNAYRRFPDGHEALVGNMTVDSNGVAGIRWWEINHATSGTPGFVQQGTYQPDNTWRWMGSAAMDASGDLAVGFSASSSSIHPQIRYAGRLAGDTPNTLAQGEATLFPGAGSQTDTLNRWGDYSDLTVDPVDGCTFWYTNEYYATTIDSDWRTRIGAFKFPSCSATTTTHSLTVTRAGSGAGTVTSSPAGISCGSACTHAYPSGTSVTLTATHAAGSVFSGWSGSGCSGTGTCTVSMSANRAVTATFTLAPRTLSVTKTGTGTGTVTSSPAGISCGSVCTHAYPSGTSVTLTAHRTAGSVFSGWSGACTGTGTCTVHMSANRSVTAIFAVLHTLRIRKAGNGSGTVKSSPAGISCGTTCAHAYAYGSSVTLRATHASGSAFTRWSGACSGRSTCTLTMSANRAATATFRKLCVVPKVKGKKLGKAKGAIKSHHCAVGKVRKAYSRTVRKGRVISQKPKAGSHRAPGAKVTLKVSRGKRP